MARIIRSHQNSNRAIVDSAAGVSDHSYFNLIRLAEGQSWSQANANHECIFAVMSGSADFQVGNEIFTGVGHRQDVWSGPADSVYAPVRAQVQITAGPAGCEIAVGGGVCEQEFEPFRIRPSEVDAVEVGSSETKSHRRICHILGQNGVGRAGNLLVSELYCEEGCWNGYPPHKHDEMREGETAHEEVYHYRFNPDSGFGGQFIYSEGEEPRAELTRHGDTIVIDRGFHPTVTSPGHEAYIFTVLVGHDQRSLVQHFEAQHTHLMAGIPGLDAMREKFRSE